MALAAPRPPRSARGREPAEEARQASPRPRSGNGGVPAPSPTPRSRATSRRIGQRERLGGAVEPLLDPQAPRRRPSGRGTRTRSPPGDSTAGARRRAPSLPRSRRPPPATRGPPTRSSAARSPASRSASGRDIRARSPTASTGRGGSVSRRQVVRHAREDEEPVERASTGRPAGAGPGPRRSAARPGPSSQGIRKTRTRTRHQDRPGAAAGRPRVRAPRSSAARVARMESSQWPAQGRPLASGSVHASGLRERSPRATAASRPDHRRPQRRPRAPCARPSANGESPDQHKQPPRAVP